MIRFVEKSNLPEGRCRSIIANGLHPASLELLSDFGAEVISFPPNGDLPAGTARHADLSLHYLGNGRFFNAEGFTVKGTETDGFCRVGNSYPADCALNCAETGRFVICNPRVVSAELLGMLSERYAVIPVKQGYTKCSTAVADANSVITEDEGITLAAEKYGLDVLRIRPGYVKLPGYDRGFFGGCSGLIAKDVFFVNGDLRRHPDAQKITDFLSARGITAAYPRNTDITDIGSIIQLTEEV